MESRARRQRVMLAALLTVFALVLAYQLWPAGSPSPAGTPAASRPGAGTPSPAGQGRPMAAGLPQVVEVGVAALEQPAPAVSGSGRNPFTFQTRTPPPSLQPNESTAGPAPPPTAPLGGQPGPATPRPAPIALKFIGILSGEGRTGRVAVLSDGKFVYYGREGDVIEGRYRVLVIGEESVQLEYVDGQGRQTIRLSGA